MSQDKSQTVYQPECTHLVDLPPNEEDNCKEVEDDQGGDEDRRLRTIIPGTLPPPSLQSGNGIEMA